MIVWVKSMMDGGRPLKMTPTDHTKPPRALSSPGHTDSGQDSVLLSRVECSGRDQCAVKVWLEQTRAEDLRPHG